MSRRATILVLALGLAMSAMRARAQSSDQKCPVAIETIQLGYNHTSGQSKPQLMVTFGNEAGKRIASVTFLLSVLDPGGSPNPYPDDLVFHGPLEAGKRKTYIWDLAPEAIDIHRTGEIVQVEKVAFSDATDWKDDGSQSCMLRFDFHPR